MIADRSLLSERMQHLFTLRDRVTVITGATRGIGLAIAEGFAEAGARVVIASRKREACEEVATRLVDLGGDAVGVATHIGDLDDVERLVRSTIEHFGQLDVLVNNAATYLDAPIGSIPPTVWHKTLDVNLRGPTFLTQAALPHLTSSEHASVINIVSAAAFMSAPDQPVYAAAKAALISLTRSAAAAYAKRGVRLNALAPGPVDTVRPDSPVPRDPEVLRKQGLFGRIAEPQEMVGPALFLASDASSFMTGEVLVVDGGMSTAVAIDPTPPPRLLPPRADLEERRP